MDELRDKMNKEKEEALRLQWEEALRQQAQAIAEACEALTRKLNREHKLDKELAIANSLKKARVCNSITLTILLDVHVHVVRRAKRSQTLTQTTCSKTYIQVSQQLHVSVLLEYIFPLTF